MSRRRPWLQLIAIIIAPCIAGGTVRSQPLAQDASDPAQGFRADEASVNGAERFLALMARADPELDRVASYIRIGSVFEASENDEGVTTDTVSAHLSDAEALIVSLCESLELPAFDFQIPNDLFPEPFPEDDPRYGYLRQVRHADRILRADALRLASHGQYDAAARRIRAIMHLGAKLSQPASAGIRGMIAAVMFKTVAPIPPSWGATPSPEVAAILTPAVAALPPGDEAHARMGWLAHRDGMSAWVAAEVSSGKVSEALLLQLIEMHAAGLAGRELFAKIVAEAGPQAAEFVEDPDELAEAQRLEHVLEELSAEDVLRRIEEAKRLGAGLEAAWLAPDAERVFRAADERIEQDESGVLGLILSSPRYTWRSSREVSESMEALRRWLAVGAEGK